MRSCVRIKVSPWIAGLACIAAMAAGAEDAPTGMPVMDAPATAAAQVPALLNPPGNGEPVVVEARFDVTGLNAIEEGAELFEFSGVMTLRWRDPRLAFDPAVAGVAERIFTGTYQFNEVSPGWYPQVVLVNESGLYEKNGVALRIAQDGTTTLTETLNATAKAEFYLKTFPFDRHRLEAVFAVLGFDSAEVQFRAMPAAGVPATAGLRLPQWRILDIVTAVQDRRLAHAGGSSGSASVFVVGMEVQRKSFYMSRLVILPLAFIVFLSFSVF